MWKDIPGFENLYQVTKNGDIRALDRRVTSRWGTEIVRKGKTLSPKVAKTGHMSVGLTNAEGKRVWLGVHVAVARAWIPNPLNLPWVLHNDDDPTNNASVNLRWGTPKDNSNDVVLHDRHPNANKTHCPQGHEYSNQNTSRYGAKRSRVCLACRRAYSATAYDKVRKNKW